MTTPHVADSLDIIKLLKSSSEAVAEYIDTQDFLCDTITVDALDIDGILTQCYYILMDELNQKGIAFHSDDDVLLGNWLDAERIFHLYNFMDYRYQISLCKSYPQLIAKLEDIINSTLQDDKFEMWLEAVMTIPTKSNDISVKIKPLLEHINATTVFEQFLSVVYDKVKNVSSDFRVPLNIVTAYIGVMHSGMQKAAAAFKILLTDGRGHELTDTQLAFVENSVKNYDIEKLQPENISNYAWAWAAKTGYNNSITYNEFPQSLKDLSDKLDYDHHSSTVHHIEYYLVHKDVPFDQQACMLLAIACYEPTDRAATMRKADAVYAAGGDRFTIDITNYFKSCMDALLSSIPMPK